LKGPLLVGVKRGGRACKDAKVDKPVIIIIAGGNRHRLFQVAQCGIGDRGRPVPVERYPGQGPGDQVQSSIAVRVQCDNSAAGRIDLPGERFVPELQFAGRLLLRLGRNFLEDLGVVAPLQVFGHCGSGLPLLYFLKGSQFALGLLRAPCLPVCIVELKAGAGEVWVQLCRSFEFAQCDVLFP
jgi:hypothetical protein